MLVADGSILRPVSSYRTAAPYPIGLWHGLRPCTGLCMDQQQVRYLDPVGHQVEVPHICGYIGRPQVGLWSVWVSGQVVYGAVTS